MKTDTTKELIKEKQHDRSHNLQRILAATSVIVVSMVVIFTTWNTSIPSASAMYSAPVKYTLAYQYDNGFTPVQQQLDIKQQDFGIEQIAYSGDSKDTYWRPTQTVRQVD